MIGSDLSGIVGRSAHAGDDDCVSPVIEKVLSAFSYDRKSIQYPGGDWYIKDELIRLLSSVPCRKCVLVEVFGGSGVVSQYAPRIKFKNVIYNDKDNLLYELFKFVKENPTVLREVLALIPYSRALNRHISTLVKDHGDELTGIVAASFLFYAINTSINGMTHAGFSTSKRFSPNRARKYAKNVNAVFETARRMRDVTVENLDFRECIKKYDSRDTVFYVDPPYVSTEIERNYYRLTFTVDDARDLSNALSEVKGYYLLKIHEDQLSFYEKINYKYIRAIDLPLNMQMKKDEKRDRYKLLFLSNFPIKSIASTISGGEVRWSD